jgi:hypothetical protein
MGIGVETSRLGRRAAELATGAICDDARQDENHADDAEQVGGVLRAERVAGVLAGRQMHDHVERTCGDHQQQRNAGEPRKGGCLATIAVFYRQHELVIHAKPWCVKSIASEKV